MIKKILSIPDKIDLLYERLQSLGDRLGAFEKKMDEVSRTAAAMNEEVRLIHAYSSAVNAKVDRLKPIVCAGDGAVLTMFEGFVMAFPGEDYGLTASYTFVDNIELGLRSLFKKIVREGMTVVDVGANVGVYTLISGRLVGETGRVYSFEPTPRVFDLLKANVEMACLQGRVELVRKAVTDEGGRKLKLSLFSSTRNNTLFGGAESDKGFTEVDTVTLDDMFSGKRVDVVKIDAEGAESRILKGMKGVVRDNPGMVIIIEFAGQHLKRAGVDPCDFIREIKGLGLSIKRVDDYTGDITPISEKELIEIPGSNVVLRRL